jgi:hypothetical protein
MKILNPVLLFIPLLLLAVAQEASSQQGGAVAAMQALPVRYNNGILLVQGKGGTTHPEQWTIIARDLDNEGDITTLTIAGGQVVSEAPSLNLGQMFRQSGYINPPSIQFDSGSAFHTAENYAEANGKILASVNYSLVQKGEDVSPIWTLDCFDAAGKSLGHLQISATKGDVISHKGFNKSP